jgi:hypothetical protein
VDVYTDVDGTDVDGTDGYKQELMHTAGRAEEELRPVNL